MKRRKPMVKKTEMAIDEAWDASRLRAAWDRADLPATPIAAACGVTPETLRQWRAGKFEPKATQLRTLARCLDVDFLSLMPPE